MADDLSDEFEDEFVPSKSNKKLSVERIYQKKTQLEHVLLRPDTYIGSVEPVTQAMWVFDEGVGMVNREVTFVPGLYKIFDEILVNAADNKQRDKNMNLIEIVINPEKNLISIKNNGQGIPVVEHKDEKMFVPSLIFGHLLTSSNYNDEERKVTGGRNGYGAKLCNIFSTKFTVETSSKQYGKQFKQTWRDNMSKSEDPQISSAKGADFTCISFCPDLAKFKMTELDKDIVALMTRRAYDVAGCTKGVKVFLNGSRLPIRDFKDYIDLYIKGKSNENDEPLKVIHEIVSERWEIAVTMSDHGFQQVSFVNSIATTKGGRHVDYITDQLTSKISEVIKKKNKGGKDVKPFQIKSHLWVFVNCLIENPTFDSQTKENMTLQVKNFGSKCPLSEKFVTSALKCGIVESIMSWVRFKAQTELEKKCSGKKTSKLKGIPKLEDANDAGTRNSIDCTLILTEGDSAKSLAVSGLGVVGRDKYGVFPLKGKMLNVREATHKQILENAEINNIIKIMGLQYKKKYETVDDLKTLRYGRLMVMTDQDQDGSHIKGLLINFIHHNWPSLLRLPFLEEFITPIVKATKGKEEKSFYSLPEFEEWKRDTPNWPAYKIKYYKGLGTSTAKEAKEYFSDMLRHRILFEYGGTDDDHAIQLAFSKKMVDMRKEWLTNGMEERKRRRELGLPELYLYGKNTKKISYNEFVNKELILFSNMDNERSIPSLVDGLKPGQRKIIFTCLKRNDKREVKVAQLAGSVAEHSAYHHGEVSLTTTIINLAQDFVGSNNINLLLPVGQFGTRLQGGKDAASPRYIFTMLNPLTKHLFSSLDSPLLNHLYDDNLKIEPEYYVPIIPTVLVNGAEGIGTGWSTKVLNYNPRDIVKNIYRMIDGQEPVEMTPWFKNFRGTIDRVDSQHYLINGEVSILDDNKIEITELPIRTWTQAYKENVLEPMLHGTEKTPSFITDYKEYHTDTTVRFVVTMTPDKLNQARSQGIHKVFKLQTSVTTTSMVLFDHLGCLRKYDSPEQILKEFFEVRSTLYEKRKEYMVGVLEAEALKLKNQARFILEKIENKIVIENKKKVEMIATLQDRGYDSDPIKAWKESQKIEKENDKEESDSEEENSSSGPDYDYLLGMSLWSLTREKKDELLRKRDDKVKELDDLKSKTPFDLWRNDLKAFTEELDASEKKELEEASEQPKGKKLTGKKKKFEEDSKPSPFGERIPPQIDEEYKRRVEKKPKEGEPRKRKKKDAEKKDDEDEKEASFADRVGVKKTKKKGSKDDDDNKEASAGVKKEKKKSSRQTTLDNFTSIKKEPKKKSPKKKKNPWSDTDDEEQSDVSDMDIDDFSAEKRAEKVTPRRAAANRIKYTFDSDEDNVMNSDVNDDGIEKGDKSDSDADSPPVSKQNKTEDAPIKNGAASSDSDDDLSPPSNDKPAGDLFDSLLGSNKANDEPSAKQKRTKDSSESDDDMIVENKKPDKAAPKKKARKNSDSSDDEYEKPYEPAPQKKASKISDSSDYEDEKPAKPAPKKKARKNSDSSDDDFKPKAKKETAPKEKKAAPKKKAEGPKKPRAPKAKKPKKKLDSDDDFGDALSMDEDKDPLPQPTREARGGRSKAPTSYKFGDSSSDGEF